MTLAPKRNNASASSAFLCYESEHRPRIEKLYPNRTNEQVTQLVQQYWIETDLETKQKYIIQALTANECVHGQPVPKADLKLPYRLPISKFHNCLVLRNHRLLKDEFWTYGSIIINPEPHFFNEKVVPDNLVDCKGAIIAPGFIDVQINGGFGVDFSFEIDTVQEGLAKVAKGVLAHGVTSFCPTLVSSFPNVYEKVLAKLKPTPGGSHGAQILGAHVEGPFINEEKKGAHDPKTLVPGFEKGVQSVADMYKHLNSIAIITIAPELKNALTVIKELDKMGIVVSVGHSVATIVQGEEAVVQGASFITHLFNAMLPFHHRDPGLVGLLGSSKIPQDKTIYYGLIADGTHTHPSTTRIAYRSYPKGVVLVTDACCAMGLSDGTYHLGQQVIEVQGTKAYIKGTNTLAGSVATMVHCIQHFWKVTSCTLVEALEAATLHPAKLMRIDKHKGTLDFGTDADFVLLNPDKLNVLSTWISGECVYTSSSVF